MKKRVISFVLLAAMLVAALPSAAVTAAAPEIKNVIYLIPDGGGYALYDFADMVKQNGGFDAAKYPNKTPTDTAPLTMRSHLAGSMTTSPYGGGITDSAAAGTAMATGHKTRNGYIGVDPNGKPIANLIEAAQSVGKSTGLVATYEWMHATPAAFSAHVMDRSDYYNLYQQIENKGIDVVLGAGYGAVGGYATIQNAVDRGYTVVSNKTDLQNVKPGEKIWGNIASTSMPYDINLGNGQATLAEMTDAAITSLSGNEEGFFLMVEGSKVDTGGHANDAVITTSEYLAFDAAFKVAIDFAKDRNDTVVVCAPDHDTGGMILKSDMASEVVQVQNGTDPSSISWTSTNHTNQNVGVWMYVPEGVSVIDGLNSVLGDTASTRTNYVIDNTALAPYVASLMGVDLAELTDELFVDVTKIGSYANGRFIFNSGRKYVYSNRSVYYEDGQEISMGNKEAVVLGGKVYVPAEIIDEEDWDYVPEGFDGFSGSGTVSDPYIMADAYDFIEFTANVISGETYSGKYFRQDADIDLAGYATYVGMGSEATFAGIYDGRGNTINVDLITDSDKCLFPYVTGTIMNLGTTGNIKCTGSKYVGGIVRSLRSGAKMINCYSTAAITGYDAAGLVWSNYGTISNCYFGGSLSGSNSKYAIAMTSSGGTYSNCYYVSGCGASQSSSGVTEVTSKAANSTLALELTRGREAAAAVAGVEIQSVLYWRQEADSLPELFVLVPTVTGVTVTPGTAIVNKGDGLQLSATVEGENYPSQKVIWSLEPESKHAGTYIAEDGYLIIDPEETNSTFTVLAKSVQNGSIGGISTITVGDTVMSEPDGSRARPYLIEAEDDLFAFTNSVLAGNQYKGVYFKQTADLDMAGYPGYTGMGKPATFSGIYNGDGHVVNLDIESASDECLFPYVDGTIMNLGTTGRVEGTEYTAGICRSIRAGGKLINCWSDADLKGSRVSGIAWSNYGLIVNCYFSGTITRTNYGFGIAEENDGGTTVNSFYLGEVYSAGQGGTEITESQMKNELVTWLNEYREDAAALAGCVPSELKLWASVDGQGPALETESNGGDGEVAASFEDVNYQNEKVAGNIVFDYCRTDCVAYIALYAPNNRLVAMQHLQITEGAEDELFALDYVLSEDVTYTLKLLLWDEELEPYTLPVSVSVTQNNQ